LAIPPSAEKARDFEKLASSFAFGESGKNWKQTKVCKAPCAYEPPPAGQKGLFRLSKAFRLNSLL
jgi:hypothetical protein